LDHDADPRAKAPGSLVVDHHAERASPAVPWFSKIETSTDLGSITDLCTRLISTDFRGETMFEDQTIELLPERTTMGVLNRTGSGGLTAIIGSLNGNGNGNVNQGPALINIAILNGSFNGNFNGFLNGILG